MSKVVKFGGSSLADANQFRKVADIIRSDKERRYVVPSAPGKRFKDDIKVTDMLYACYDAVANEGKNAYNQFAPIAERFNGIISDLGLTLSLDDEYEVIIDNFRKKAGKDYAASRGEYLNGIILANYLGYEFVDAAKVVFFRPDGKFDDTLTDTCLASVLHGLSHAVIPGFYGANPDGTVRTFSRGGSDVTGSIVAKAINAELYENWTDVNGFLIADPRIVDEPKVIESITYKELRELSYMGASVLHEAAIFPVRSAKIPINIRNTNDPSAKGTMIVAEDNEPPQHIITGIAGKKHFSVISIEKDEMNSEIGFLRRILTVLEANGMCFEHIPTGIDTMSIIVDGKDVDKDMREITKELGVVFQNTVLDAKLSVKDNLTSRAALYGITGKEAKQRIAHLAELLEFKDILNRTFGKLSGGQKRRVDVARALLNNPKILILDEPTTGLDPEARKALWSVVTSLRKNQNMTVFLTTHYMEEAADADYVVILDSGKISAEGTPLELKNNYTGDFVTIYNVDEDKIKALGLPYENIRDAVRIAVKNTEEARDLIVRHPDLFTDFEITKGKMDDVFLAVTGKKLEGGAQ